MQSGTFLLRAADRTKCEGTKAACGREPDRACWHQRNIWRLSSLQSPELCGVTGRLIRCSFCVFLQWCAGGRGRSLPPQAKRHQGDPEAGGAQELRQSASPSLFQPNHKHCSKAELSNMEGLFPRVFIVSLFGLVSRSP